MSLPAVPQHHPTQRELDDLELLTDGAYHPIASFNEPGSAVTLALPDELATYVDQGGSVELVDPEGLPLATVQRGERGLAVESLSHAEHGPFRRLYRSPEQVRVQCAGRTFVPVRDALTDAQFDQLQAVDNIVFLALVGTGTPALSPVGLLRATLRVAEDLGAEVVAVPLPSHDDPAADASLRTAVIANYAGDDPLLELVEGGSTLPEVADIVLADRPPPDEQGLVLFFTGLSGSGKSTLARALMDRLLERGGRTLTSLDGDVVRRNLSAGLTFSKDDRETNIRRIGWVAAEISRHGGIAVCSPIAPFDETRKQVRAMVDEAGGAFFLVHVATPLEECERRDRKGLYAKARRGEIPEFTGISSPYEVPEDADVRVDTTGHSIDEALDDVLGALRDAGYLDLTDDPVSPEAVGRHTAPVQPVGEVRGAPATSLDTTGEPVVEARGAPATTPETNVAGRAAAARDEQRRTETTRPLKILFVCTANICRSPYMELRARNLAAEMGAGQQVEFSSAGTHGFHENPVDQTMAQVLAVRGLSADDIAGFRSRRLTRQLVDAADLVLTAEASHRSFVLDEAHASFRKVYTLGQFAESVQRLEGDLGGAHLVSAVGHRRAGTSPTHDVADPYNRGLNAAERAAQQIDDLLRAFLPRLILTDRTTA